VKAGVKLKRVERKEDKAPDRSSLSAADEETAANRLSEGGVKAQLAMLGGNGSAPKGSGFAEIMRKNR
jgi:hypothetical protein